MATIYMGSFDDRVYYYPWSFSNLTNRAYLNSYLMTILQNTIIGHKSAINDGYLLNNPVLRDNLFLDDSSLLRRLLYSGEIKIPARKPNFHELIKQQVEQGIHIFDKIPPNVLDRIPEVDGDPRMADDVRIDGPESIDVWTGFFKLMTSLEGRDVKELQIATNVTQDEFKRALDCYFETTTATKPASRTQWEDVLEDLTSKRSFKSGKDAKLTLMNLGNEAYSYNYAQLLSEKHKRIDVETVNSPAFSHFLDVKRMDFESRAEEIPLIKIPRLHKFLEEENIKKLLDKDSLVGRARNEFISALEKFEEKPNDTTLVQLKKTAEDYNKLLHSEFNNSGFIQNIATGVNLVLSTTLGGGVLCWFLAEAGTRIIIKKFITDQPRKIDYRNYLMATSKMKSI